MNNPIDSPKESLLSHRAKRLFGMRDRSLSDRKETSSLEPGVSADRTDLGGPSENAPTAREIQSRFLPVQPPAIAGVDYSGDCQPGAQAGEDFFDFRSPGRNQLVISVGTVWGHGLRAAVLASNIQAFLRGLTTRGSRTIPSEIEELNRVVCRITPQDMCVTLFYAHFDPQTRELRYISAGHEPSLLLRQCDNQIQRLHRTGTVLGLTVRARYGQRTIRMGSGDMLVVVSDGVTDAACADGRTWAEDGVLNVLLRCKNARSSELVAQILESASRFADPRAAAPDRTVVVARLWQARRHALNEQKQEIELASAAA